ncbi:hypothetical protein CVIRNUC_007963 [Coccomyxa viridis]|uniref:Anaphase-promoting complex subunit 2 n=1 Tax=Coccomyxa viridis TaxID=1274662 RepID=A0AAV1IFJ9_9CHLO|nr:hypothetical protein CVIRNUC_007963 [Coccomyxa viridis]
MVDVEAWSAFTQFADRQMQISTETFALRQAVASQNASISTLCSAGFAELASNYVLGRAEEVMQQACIPQFWSALATAPASGAELETCLHDSLQGLSKALQQHEQLLCLLRAQLLHKGPGPGSAARCHSSSVMGMCMRYQQAVSAMVQDAAPVQLTGLLEAYFTGKLDELSQKWCGNEAIAVPLEGMPDDSATAESVMGPAWVHPLAEIASALEALGMQEQCTSACASAVCKHVQAHVHARPDWDQGMLDQALDYVGAVPLPMLALISPNKDRALSSWAKRLQYYVYETVGAMRIGQFFDIVVGLPESLPALADVRGCLQHTNSHARFIQRFGAAISLRLLHPGAATPDIIAQYVGCIKALREVDPAGILLNAVGRPIKAYLRSRKDTIRCIVASLTEEAEGGESPHAESLAEELKQPPEPEEDDMKTDTDDWADFQAALRWRPDPVEVDLLQAHKKESGTDIISMLVAIYGSKELFINEYRSMLAEKLLSKGDYDCDREIRTLELLKLRFGELNLLNCEIMLKDMADSKRVDANIHNIAPQAMSPLRRARRAVRVDALSATIISSLFWPPHQEEEDFALPQQLQAQMAAYAARFSIVKTPRKLVWMKHLGSVDLTLTVGPREVDFTVTPIHAAIIMHFKERPTWHAAELAAAMHLAQDALRKRALFWIGHGVLEETRTPTGTVFSRCERLEVRADGGAAVGEMAMEEDTDAPTAAEAQAQQDMAVYEQYIMGMLTNFDSGLPLDRIHNMLKMFCSTPPYDRTAEQLARFLGTLVAAEKIACVGHVYKKATPAAAA